MSCVKEKLSQEKDGEDGRRASAAERRAGGAGKGRLAKTRTNTRLPKSHVEGAGAMMEKQSVNDEKVKK